MIGSARHALERWWRRTRRAGLAAASASTAAEPDVAFLCNLCGTPSVVAASAIGREIPSCRECGSTVRWRAVVHLACTSVLGREAAIPDLAKRDDIAGLGLSDDACVARAFARAFAYTNTYFHRAPHLDIADIPDAMVGRYDFVCASDVFEHVAPPVAAAFVNARRLLKPGGTLVFTVPFTLEPETAEHFPDLHDFRLQEGVDGWVLHNRTRDGRRQTFDQLVFHGGPGTTLEMRVFARADLERHFAAAGFREWRFAGEACPRFGIAWPEPWSIPIVATA